MSTPRHLCPMSLPTTGRLERSLDGGATVRRVGLIVPFIWVGFDWNDDGTYTDLWRCPACGEVEARTTDPPSMVPA
jgi:hypothetical protein